MATPSPDIAAIERLRILLISDTADMDPSPETGGMWRLAETLSHRYDVILAFPERTAAQHADFAVIYYNQRNIALLARDSDVVIFTQGICDVNPSLAGLGNITAISNDQLQRGDLPADGLQPAGQHTDSPKAGDLLAMWPRRPEASNSPGHYLRQLWYHLRQGGIRRVASQGRALIKRRIRIGKRKN